MEEQSEFFDTIKDLFDIYFLFKSLEPINLKQMLLDLEMEIREKYKR